jgi:K+/H+ antiporter YhaU regulatory subunit KhtT
MILAGASAAFTPRHILGAALAARASQKVSPTVAGIQHLGLEGQHPIEAGVRDKTGCSVVAVERGDDLLVEFGPEFRFTPGDAIYICGSEKATRRFAEIFPQDGRRF